jgi:beta-galactosidase
MATFEVPYKAGKLEALASNGGKEVARFAVETTGPAAALRLVLDRPSLSGDGWDAQPITVEVVDAQGRLVPTAEQLVKFKLSGPGAIIGLNNGDPTNHEPEKGDQHQVFHGLAQVIVQSSLSSHGKLTLSASSEGLTTGESVIDVIPVAARLVVPVVLNPPLFIQNWRRSPTASERPDPNEQPLDIDMNSWRDVHPGWMAPFREGHFAVYRARFTPRAATRQTGGHLLFRDLIGKAQVWINGKLAGEKTGAEKQDFTVALPAGDGERTVNVLVEAEPGKPAGLGGVVTVE